MIFGIKTRGLFSRIFALSKTLFIGLILGRRSRKDDFAKSFLAVTHSASGVYSEHRYGFQNLNKEGDL
jgi:hypothetical protein